MSRTWERKEMTPRKVCDWTELGRPGRRFWNTPVIIRLLTVRARVRELLVYDFITRERGYRITGNFRGKKFSRIDRKGAFAEKIFTEC